MGGKNLCVFSDFIFDPDSSTSIIVAAHWADETLILVAQ